MPIQGMCPMHAYMSVCKPQAAFRRAPRAGATSYPTTQEDIRREDTLCCKCLGSFAFL